MLTHTKVPPVFYSFDPRTHEYVGLGECDLSPARYKRGHEQEGHLIEPNVAIVPGHATLIAPPKVKEKQVAVWKDDPKGGYWEVWPDYRGELRWFNGEFVTITSIGEPAMPPITVHDAWYVLTGDDFHGQVRIAAWINEDLIEFDDIPDSIPRRVVAAWEAKGETIRPVKFDDSEFTPTPEPGPPTDPEEAKTRLLDKLRADLDTLGIKP